METLFSQLYPFVFMIGLAGYGPQLYKLARDPDSAAALSLSTWLTWAFTWFISLGYGMTKLDDLMFSLTAGMNLAAHCVIVAMIVSHRVKTSVHVMSFQTLKPVYLRSRNNR